VDADLQHTFPQIERADGKIVFHFKRQCSKPGLNYDVSLQELCTAYNTKGHEHKPLTQYLIHIFKLLNSISNLNHLIFFQTFIKYYPLDILEEIAEKCSQSFFEYSNLVADATKNIHFCFFKMPLEQFPVQIQIMGDKKAKDAYIASANEVIKKAKAEILSPLELEVLEEKNIKDDCTKILDRALTKKGNLVREFKAKRAKDQGYDREVLFSTLVKLRAFVETSLDDISIEDLKEANEIFCDLLKNVVKDVVAQKVTKRQEAIQNDLEHDPKLKKTQIEPAKKETPGGQPRGPSLAPGADIALEILHMYSMIDKKFTNIAAIKIVEAIIDKNTLEIGDEDEGKKAASFENVNTLAGMVASSSHDKKEKVAEVYNQNKAVLGLLAAQKSLWKNRSVLYGVQKVTQKLQHLDNLKDDIKKYSTDSLVQTLFQMILFKKTQITREVINELRQISKFENNLYTEIKKMTLVKHNEDLDKVKEIIRINCQLSHYIRMHKCKEFFNKTIATEKLKEMYVDIDKMVNTLLFSIYNPDKHFRYKDFATSAEERFLEGFKTLKKPRWDPPFKINPKAVNRVYQKIFNTLQIPRTLFNLVMMTIAITGDTYTDMDYVYVIRKVLVILCAFVYNNQENQFSVYDQKYMILCFYQQSFINQTCDTLMLFNELMRDNKSLQKLPIKYLYDITWYTFLGTIKNRSITNYETNSYHCTSIMGLHFLSRMTIGGFNAEACITLKFQELVKALLNIDPNLHVLNQFEKNTANKVIPEPYHYYSIREFFCSWMEIRPKFVKNSERLDVIFKNIKLTDWTGILTNQSLTFQFELRKLMCKALEATWYGKQASFKISNNFTDFKDFVFKLFSDISAFIWITSKISGTSEYAIEVDADSFFAEDAYLKQLKGDAEKFWNLKATELQLMIYIENINIMNLWKEYIYEGCIGLLNTMVQKEAENMTFIFDHSDTKFPNLMAYYLYFLDHIARIHNDVNVELFQKLDDDLVKISVLPEYKKIKVRLNEIALQLRESRPELKMRSRMSVTSKTKTETGQALLELELDRLLKERKQTKEKNTLRLAYVLGTMPESKPIIEEIIAYITKEHKKMKPCEVTFIMMLLRKIIEKENSETLKTFNFKGNDDNEDKKIIPIYSWDVVRLRDLQKMQRIQAHFMQCNLTEFLMNIAVEEKGTNVLKEFLQLCVAYLYGGNADVQNQFYQKFISDYDNSIINKLRELFEKYVSDFKSNEKHRMNSLYRESVRDTFERLEDASQAANVQNNTFFSNVRENFPPDLKIPCEDNKGPTMLILIFTFIQSLAEGQCTSIQNFMREQVYTDANGETKYLNNSFNILGEFRSLFNAYFRVHSEYNLNIGLKLIDVMTEYIQGDVQENINNLLHKTLLFDMTRVLTDFNNPYHLLPRGYDADPYAGSFRVLKGKVIVLLKTLVEFPDDKIRDKIRNYLDISGLMEVFEAYMYKFFGFENVGSIPKGVDQRWFVDKVSKLRMEDFDDGALLDALNIYMIFRYLWVETNFEDNSREFKEKMDLLINDKKRSKRRVEILELLIHSFCPKLVHGIEVIIEQKLVTCWFPILPVCRYLLESSKNHFETTVDRSNIQTKVAGLMGASDEMIPQMHNDYQASRRFYGFNATRLYFWMRMFGDMLAIAINVINLACLEYDATNSDFPYSGGGSIANKVFVAVNIGAAALILILWFLTSSKRHLSSQWERYSDAKVKELGTLPGSIKAKLEERQYTDLSKEEVVQVLRLNGMNSEEYTILVQDPYLYNQVWSFLMKKNAFFMCKSKTFIWHFCYLGLSIGSLFTPICSTLLIADIAIQSEAIMQVFRAMGTNWKQFLWTLFLLANIALFYTFISFYAMQDEMVDSDGNQLCQYAFGCFLNILDSGLRAGGGIADVISGQVYGTDHVGHFFGRVVYDLTFFIIMITILLNLIFGMIIDAFGNLRDKKNENEEDAANKCFICGIDRSEFERYMNFDDHVNKEHNKWDYIYFITYIKEKYKNKRTEMTQIENYVSDRCKYRNFQWFPQTRSLTLEKRKERALNSDDDKTEYLIESVNTLNGDMGELKKKLKDISAIHHAMETLTTEIKEIRRKMQPAPIERSGSMGQ